MPHLNAVPWEWQTLRFPYNITILPTPFVHVVCVFFFFSFTGNWSEIWIQPRAKHTAGLFQKKKKKNGEVISVVGFPVWISRLRSFPMQTKPSRDENTQEYASRLLKNPRGNGIKKEICNLEILEISLGS